MAEDKTTQEPKADDRARANDADPTAHVTLGGVGWLVTDGRRSKCTFSVRQDLTGRIEITLEGTELLTPGIFNQMVLPAPARLEGTTDDGLELVTNDGLMLLNADLSRETLEVSADWLVAGDEDAPVSRLEFDLVNLPQKSRVRVPLKVGGHSVEAYCVPKPDFYPRRRRVSRHKDREVLGHIEIPNPEHSNEELRVACSSLCRLMSIAAGTRVNFIATRHVAVDGETTTTLRLEDRVTSRFASGLAPIDLRRPGDLPDFLECCYDTFNDLDAAYALNRGVIDAYVDARVEGDMLEVRGVKIAAFLEILKAKFLKQRPELATVVALGGNGLSKNKFGDLISKARKAARESLSEKNSNLPESKRMSEEQVKTLIGSIRENDLNRTDFKVALRYLRDALNAPIADDELDRAANNRNLLLHEGEFLSATEKNAVPWPFSEYLFLLSVADRLVLALVGYQGPYLDLRKFPGEGVRSRFERVHEPQSDNTAD